MADIKIIVDSSDVATATNRVDQLGSSGTVAQKGIDKAARGMNQFGAVAKNGGKKLNTFNMQIQQGGYQLQDFVVQLQSGTSFFTAFGQQGSQFAGVFGPQGAVIGAVIAIGSAIGGIGYRALTAANAVKDFKEQLEDTSSVMEEYISLASKSDDVFASLFKSSKTALSQTSQAAKDLLLIAKTEALDSIRGLGKSLADTSTEAGFWAKVMLNTDRVVTGNLLNIDTQLKGNITTWKETGKEVQAFIDEVRNIGKADSIDGMYQSALKARDIFKQTVDVTGEMTEDQKSFWKELSTTILNLETMGATVEAMNGSWSDTSEAIDAATASMKLFYEYAERDAEAQDKRTAAVDKIKDALANTLLMESRRVEIAQAGANLDEVLAKHAREDFILKKKSENIVGNNLAIALEAYDNAVAALQVESDRNATLSQRSAAEKALADANAAYDKAAAAADAKAKAEAQKLLDLQIEISATPAYEPMSALAVEAAKSQAEMVKIFKTTAALKEELGESAFEALRLGGVDLSNVDAASKSAALLAARLGYSYEEALKLQKISADPLDAFGGAGPFIPNYVEDDDKEPVVKESDLEKLRSQLDLEDALLGKTEARQRVIQALGVKFVEDNPKTVAGLEKQINKNLELVRVEQERIDLANTIGSAMEDSLMSMVDGTKSVKDAFRDMAADIVRHLYKVLVVQQMINSFGGMLSGSSNPILKTLGGGLESYGSADGGGYTGNGPRSGGLDGKGGFMMMMHPRETVVDHTKANSGGGGDNVVINQSFNFQANGDDSVKKIIAQAAPQIAQMTKNSMLNDRRRGGTTKAVFG